ncbi:uncharacterized protein UV8b_02773 [Ustilaginoidea virens]|uniref:Uncharacterized protein n=1 Tax=Ustilaginoidea virens TaxID=1159556 RepID=A0A063BQ36_USTVR|nr:uncharacterized protein UV8b_02773 [Ustilaginoidea virens]QUC18532.1 hypothetical protein UV8b_02773 [Ustilaginoidea virens]GAO18901.1 hypothetical protein UVI_02030700 [Ustilaginoidea virens]
MAPVQLPMYEEEFYPVDTTKGPVLVSSSLLPIPRPVRPPQCLGAATASWPSTTSTSPATPDADSAQPTTDLPPAYLGQGPDAPAVAHGGSASWTHHGCCYSDTRCCEPTQPESLSPALSDGPLDGQAQEGAVARPEWPCDDRSVCGAARGSTTSWSRQMSTAEEAQPVPSYMKPNAIMARALLLKCDLPSIGPSRGAGPGRSVGRGCATRGHAGVSGAGMPESAFR